MANATKRAILLAHEANYVPRDWAAWSALVRCAARAARIAVCRCNGSPLRELAALSPAQQKDLDRRAAEQEDEYERQDERNDTRLRQYAETLGLEIDLQGDPRGAVVKVRGQGIRGNSWGGEGWFCVA